MTEEQLKIYSRIVDIRREILENIDPSQMELNQKVSQLYKEWDELQKQCEHVIVNGKCTVCGYEVKND